MSNMSKKYSSPYVPEVNYSKFLEKEFNKSLQFQKKHEKEISTLIAYQQNMKQEKQKNEHKLQRLFQKEKIIEIDKKQKEAFLRDLKVNKDQQQLQKQKESEYLQSLDASWCFYQDYSPGRDFKPIQVSSERARVIGFLENALKKCQDPIEKAQLKLKLKKLINSEDQFKKNNGIETKMKHAHHNRNENLDKSIDKIKQHDLHIQDVLDKNQMITEEKYQYYKDKMDFIQGKIKFIEDQQKLNQLKKRNIEHDKIQKRQIIKSNSQQILLQKDLIHINHLEEKNLKINYLDDQRYRLIHERSQLIEIMDQQKKFVRNQIENVKYPALNSINYKALNY